MHLHLHLCGRHDSLGDLLHHWALKRRLHIRKARRTENRLPLSHSPTTDPNVGDARRSLVLRKTTCDRPLRDLRRK